MSLSMPNTRKVIRKQEAVADQLKRALKAKGVTRHAQREKLAERAAAGRPADIREHALEALRERRVQRSLALLAGELA